MPEVIAHISKTKVYVLSKRLLFLLWNRIFRLLFVRLSKNTDLIIKSTLTEFLWPFKKCRLRFKPEKF